MEITVHLANRKGRSPRVRQSPGETVLDVIVLIVLIVIALSMIYPMYYVIILSFSEGTDALKGGIFLWPRSFTLANYMTVFTNSELMSSFIITILRTVIGTILSVLFIAMAAYALSVHDLPGRRFFNKFFFFTTIFSGGMIPTICLLQDLDLLDNFWVYILPAIFSFYNILLVRTSFEGIPAGLKEAAQMEGAGDFRIFFQIYLPLSKPVLATVALFTAVFHWNDWFAGSYYITSDYLKPAATILQEMLQSAMNELSNSYEGGASATTNSKTLEMAFTVVITFPIMVIYPFLQKYFTKGALIGSIKE